jgi:hypothetical protein
MSLVKLVKIPPPEDRAEQLRARDFRAAVSERGIFQVVVDPDVSDLVIVSGADLEREEIAALYDRCMQSERHEAFAGQAPKGDQT